MATRSDSHPVTNSQRHGLLGSITHVRTCTGCSTSISDSGRFCPTCGSELAVLASTDKGAVAASLVGKVVDGFAIEGVIGGGAFGTVYLGRQQGLDRRVALKVPTYEIAADPVMSKRF